MNLYKIFHCTNDQIVRAEQFMADSNNLHGRNNSFILPDFIRFCSLIVHPLMKDSIFKKALYTNFRIGNYYNLLNRNISDADMGIGLSVDVHIDPHEDEVKSGDDDQQQQHRGNDGMEGLDYGQNDIPEINDNIPRLNDQESGATSLISPISPPETVNNKSNSANIQISPQQPENQQNQSFQPQIGDQSLQPPIQSINAQQQQQATSLGKEHYTYTHNLLISKHDYTLYIQCGSCLCFYNIFLFDNIQSTYFVYI